MLDLRLKIQKLLVEDPELQAIVAPAQLFVFQRSGLVETEPPEVRPFIVHNFGPSVPSEPSALRAHAQIVQVWIHDEPGDYHRIDQMLQRIKVVFEAAEAEDEFLELRQIDRSPDFNDLGLNTIVKYATFQAAVSPGGL